jgi:hypothetical protein
LQKHNKLFNARTAKICVSILIFIVPHLACEAIFLCHAKRINQCCDIVSQFATVTVSIHQIFYWKCHTSLMHLLVSQDAHIQPPWFDGDWISPLSRWTTKVLKSSENGQRIMNSLVSQVAHC